ncbi:MAG: NAD(P)-dependent glycerol-3-phosphate dehydrogenase [Cytophagales bacterium]|nr:NAD(P)-dependent glycerol-3-phosphate dehydrogenase [Cytophagales bacterium]
MNSKTYSRPVGVVGAGSFGTAVANILAINNQVLLYARKPEVVEEMLATRQNSGQKLHLNVEPTHDLEQVAQDCEMIFPVVPSANFRELMRRMAPYLRPYHILIHGTKGLDLSPANKKVQEISRAHISTMSEVILQETCVLRVGCLAGPNLAKELADGQPAATVVASRYNEVIEEGISLLKNDRFQVYGSTDLIGVELSGVLKNIIAIASGIISGIGLGENFRGVLISRGMVEMIYIGRALGGNTEAFLGLAGIGDLVTTCSSQHSRNFTVGYRLAQGQSLEQISSSMEEVAEGVNTIKIIKNLSRKIGIRPPITEALYKVLFEGLDVHLAIGNLMKYPYNTDVDFL